MRARNFITSLLLSVCFLINFNQHVVLCETYQQFLARTLPELCPYSKFCTTGPAKPFTSKKYSPCCKLCSCETDCVLTGSCCPDSPEVIDTNAQIKPIAECSIAVHYSYEPLTSNLVTYGSSQFELNTYYIIKTCPEKYSNPEVVSKCINPDTDRGFTQKHIPVVSDGRGYAFFNQYCAICNGVNMIIRWTLQLICLASEYKINDINDQQQLRDNRCLIVSSPPTTTIGRQSRCFLSTGYSKCNMTGKWVTRDPNTERACESTIYQYYETTFIGEIVHRNPFCYKCNNDGSESISNICQKDEVDSSGKGIYPGSFTGMIKIRDTTPTREVTKCGPSDVFDYYFERCRPLQCPATLTARDGKCVQVFHETDGLSIKMLIEVKIAQDNPIDDYAHLFDTEPDTHADLEHFILALLEDIGMTKHGCMICPTKLWQRKDKTGLLILVAFGTNAGPCTAASIIETANTWQLGLNRSSNAFVTKHNKRLQFSTGLAYYDIPQKYDDTSAYLSNYVLLFSKYYVSCMGRVFLQPMFYCAFVDITQDEYADLMSRNRTDIRMDAFIPVTVETGMIYRICLDRYLHSEITSTGVSLSPGVALAALIVIMICATTRSI